MQSLIYFKLYPSDSRALKTLVCFLGQSFSLFVTEVVSQVAIIWSLLFFLRRETSLTEYIGHLISAIQPLCAHHFGITLLQTLGISIALILSHGELLLAHILIKPVNSI